MNVILTKNNLEESLNDLIANPTMRAFLFRTRFERTMIKLSAYANEINRIDLSVMATSALEKMRSIVDKSNTTSDGTLQSYRLLVGDMERILSLI